jgi:uncharacterized protein YdaU (DUF1376 family)
MAKDPAFLFYPNDYIGGTMGMTFEEKGAYMELLMLQFNRGHMTSHMIGQVVGQLWLNIEVKFKKDENGLYYNERLDEEIFKRKKFTESRRNNVLGTNQHKKNKEIEIKKGGQVVGHMTSHMENANENTNPSMYFVLNNKECDEKLEDLNTIKLSGEKTKENQSGWLNEFELEWINCYKELKGTAPTTFQKEDISMVAEKLRIKLTETGQISTNESLVGTFTWFIKEAHNFEKKGDRLGWIGTHFTIKNINNQFDQIYAKSKSNHQQSKLANEKLAAYMQDFRDRYPTRDSNDAEELNF